LEVICWKEKLVRIVVALCIGLKKMVSSNGSVHHAVIILIIQGERRFFVNVFWF
jgi:hypothetical protein